MPCCCAGGGCNIFNSGGPLPDSLEFTISTEGNGEYSAIGYWYNPFGQSTHKVEVTIADASGTYSLTHNPTQKTYSYTDSYIALSCVYQVGTVGGIQWVTSALVNVTRLWSNKLTKSLTSYIGNTPLYAYSTAGYTGSLNITCSSPSSVLSASVSVSSNCSGSGYCAWTPSNPNDPNCDWSLHTMIRGSGDHTDAVFFSPCSLPISFSQRMSSSAQQNVPSVQDFQGWANLSTNFPYNFEHPPEFTNPYRCTNRFYRHIHGFDSLIRLVSARAVYGSSSVAILDGQLSSTCSDYHG